tara:strand:- start:10 stop:159 length:150 start_codon:yes stop_codon:yes gene_type:complete
VISNFQPVGYKIGGVSENKAVQFSILGILLMVLILLFTKINTYLGNYKK